MKSSIGLMSAKVSARPCVRNQLNDSRLDSDEVRQSQDLVKVRERETLRSTGTRRARDYSSRMSSGGNWRKRHVRRASTRAERSTTWEKAQQPGNVHGKATSKAHAASEVRQADTKGK